ncbi:MAG: SPFH domain-containing protein [Actinomycetota bacterium]|nr:SPFH domain-containing protein [Actinomycetota bacterium]
MATLIFGAALLFLAFIVRAAGGARAGGTSTSLARLAALGLVVAGALVLGSASIKVIPPGTVGVQHAFGKVSALPLYPGVRFVPPWAEIERFSTREEQFPVVGDQVERMAVLSNEQMGMTVDVAVRWKIDPTQAPRIFTDIGNEDQIRSLVLNAIRNGVRDGMVEFSINDLARRNDIARSMEAEVDSALSTQPRTGGTPFRIATLTAFFLRDLQPPEQVVQAINNKIAQEQLIATERHRVEVARLQAEQQRLLNQTLTPEALTKQYLEVLAGLSNTSNSVILIPTEGGVPMLDVAALRRNLQRQ